MADKRDTLLDFVKGCAVGGMLVHHALNYFPVEAHSKMYVRFVSGSFPFFAGYIINFVLGNRFQAERFSRTLTTMLRGFKLPLLFVVCNVLLWIVGLEGGTENNRPLRFLQLMAQCLSSGTYRGVAFDLLVPIGYTIVFVSFIRLWRLWLPITWIAALASIAVGCIIYTDMSAGYNFRYLAIGLFGAALGTIHQHITKFLQNQWWLVVALFTLYVITLPMVHIKYPFYVLMVVINVSMLYCIGNVVKIVPPVFNVFCLVGQYSLFAYLFQILVFQALRAVLPMAWQSPVIGCAIATIITTMAIWIVFIAIHRSMAFKQGYALIFK